MKQRPLSEQVIVITGASSGIGRCAAGYLAARGARVVLTARRGWALEALAAEIRDAGGQALAVAGDVTSEPDMRAVAGRALERFGRIDTWVNAAAVYIQGRDQDITLDEYRRVLDVNVIGVINGTKQALGPMLRQGSGVIIQISSIVGRRGAPYTSAYSASKHALDGFDEALRSELWGTGIEVSTLYLPSVDTPIYQNARGKLGTMPKPAPPVSRPEAVARVIAELAVSGERSRLHGIFRYFYLGIERISPIFADWALHHTGGFTLTEIPAGDDNVDRPTPSVPPVVHGGWAEPGVRGFTAHEIVRVLPAESLLAAAALGFAAGVASRRLGRG